MRRAETLERALELTTKYRDDEYGSPGGNGLMISRMWSAYLGIDIKPHDVFLMMALVKIARTKHSPDKQDHYDDLAGYAACAAEVAGSKDKDPVTAIVKYIEMLSEDEKENLRGMLDGE